MDKGLAKELFDYHGIPTPKGICLKKGEAYEGIIPFPCVVFLIGQNSRAGFYRVSCLIFILIIIKTVDRSDLDYRQGFAIHYSEGNGFRTALRKDYGIGFGKQIKNECSVEMGSR